ncbi:MAG TPA: flagellar biosynthesis protein FlhB [Burkholderiaceae bacterium]|jgi:flagellar biosynthetic protein FlhB|nr:flagellar biosynthesis protein FlhB [Burkholderiaceae bacterium]
MADQDAQDRNLPASQRKLDKAREDGQVARSRDLGHFAAIAAGGAALVVMAPTLADWLAQMVRRALRFDVHAVVEPGFMTERLAELAPAVLLVAVPLGVLLALVAAAGSAIAGGWVWSLKPLGFKFEKLDPFAGIKRIASKQQLVDTAKASALAVLLVGIGAIYLRSHLPDFGAALGLPLPAALPHVGATLTTGLLLLVLLLGAFALFDVPWQRYRHRSRLKMSRQEAKQELKELEGNVEVKGKVKARMREMANRRMIAAVPKADLVVMNPTHYAVALRYDEASMGAPRVVAKGADLLAMRIRDVAKGAAVPVLQAPVLARALYAHAEIDREIPAALFAAVAQVLAYVYQLRAAMQGRAPMPGDLPAIDVPAGLDPHPARDVEGDAA